MNIAEKLIQLRKDNNITQEKLSKDLKISISAIHNYENIKSPRIPKNEILLAFAKYYNVSTEYLLNDSATNVTSDNITINNKLNLSDKTIEKIVEINTKVNSEIIGKFIDFLPVKEFWGKINEYITTSKEIAELLPINEIANCSKIFKKYVTNNEIDLSEYELSKEEFYSNNKCLYTAEDRKILLNCIDILKSNVLFEDYIGCNDEVYDYFITNYGLALDEMVKMIKSNCYIPKSFVKEILNIPDYEINKRIQKREILGFYISKELNKFLSYLENEEAE